MHLDAVLLVHAKISPRVFVDSGLSMNRFPIESRGRRKKLREVGCVTAICAACFTLRAVIVAWSAIDSEDADLVRSAKPFFPFSDVCNLESQVLSLRCSSQGCHSQSACGAPYGLLVSDVVLQKNCQASTHFRSLCHCAGRAQSSFPQSDLLHRM